MNYGVVIAIIILAFLSYRAVRMASQFEIYARYRWNNSLHSTKSSQLASRIISSILTLTTVSLLCLSYAFLYHIIRICLVITYQTQGIRDSDMYFGILYPIVAVGLVLCYMPMRKSAAEAFSAKKIEDSINAE